MIRRFSTYLYNHPGVLLALLLGPPLGWMLMIYLGSLAALLFQSFYYLDGFTGQVVREFSFLTYRDLFSAAHMTIVLKTVVMALSVTIGSVLIAFPLAYYSVRYAGKRLKVLLYFAVLLPLWSSYIIRVYAWKLMLAKEGIVSWFFAQLGLSGVLEWLLSMPIVGGASLSVSNFGLFLVFTYIWLPYMILPIQSSLERIPHSLLDASGDLGARPLQTFRRIVLPLALPGVVAGSIFTFSLTLGDYIIPSIIGDSTPFIGMAVYSYQGTAGNLPLAAAFTVLPMVMMVFYLLGARKAGAFDAL
ncbi:MAG TPA: ABC transporter permease [Rhodothermales bacterium]|nr:ABC transporter permease [Rhodothermales bacterium]HRR09403.1 ABC transporter permease [Rhodothermales bacterium]